MNFGTMDRIVYPSSIIVHDAAAMQYGFPSFVSGTSCTRVSPHFGRLAQSLK